jgi:hypothetical protein
LDDATKLYLVVLFDNLPEPVHGSAVFKVLCVAVSYPVFNVDSAGSTHLSLQLFRGEVFNPLNRNDGVESLTKLIKLWLYTDECNELALQINEFLFVIVGHPYLSATGFEFSLYLLSNISSEVLFNDLFKLCQVVLNEKLKRIVHVKVNQFKISKLNVLLFL